MDINPYASPEGASSPDASDETAERPLGPTSWPRFRSPRLLGVATIAMLCVFMIVLLISVWVSWSRSRLAKRVLNRGKVTEAQLTESDARVQKLVIVRAYAFGAMVLILLCWVYRVHKNLYAFGVERLTVPPILAAAFWVTPVLNLYWPYKAVCDVWKGSDIDYIGGRSGRWREAPTHEMFLVWWIVTLVWWVVGWMIPPYTGPKVFWQHEIEQVRTISLWQMADDLVGLLPSAMLCLIVLLIDERQLEAHARVQALVNEDV